MWIWEVPKIERPQYRPHYTVVLVIRTPKYGIYDNPLIFLGEVFPRPLAFLPEMLSGLQS